MKGKITVFVAAAMICLVAVLSVGCQSSSFVDYSKVGFNAVDVSKCDILGSVTFVGEKNKGASYTQLLQCAKEKYPDVDEVVNVHVDSDGVGLGPIKFGQTLTVTGIAVRYRKTR